MDLAQERKKSQYPVCLTLNQYFMIICQIVLHVVLFSQYMNPGRILRIPVFQRISEPVSKGVGVRA